MRLAIRIRPLERGDIRDRFGCGEPLLDLFLHKYAGQNQFRHHIAVTYVAVEESSREVLGYVTVSGATLEPASSSDLPDVPYKQVPVLRIARLAVDRRVQGAGLGSDLLEYALRLALEQDRLSGCVGVIVDAKPAALPFYERFGFVPCGLLQGGVASRPRPVPMFLGLGVLRTSLEG